MKINWKRDRYNDESLELWTMPIKDWKPALNRFAIAYDDRFPL